MKKNCNKPTFLINIIIFTFMKIILFYIFQQIMKPLLERKRRARINKCLDELKDIMTAALQSQGENVSKLEKADILELTVRHLHKMQQARRLMTTSRNPLEEIHRYVMRMIYYSIMLISQPKKFNILVAINAKLHIPI